MSFQDRAQHSIGQVDKEVRTACLPGDCLPILQFTALSPSIDLRLERADMHHSYRNTRR